MNVVQGLSFMYNTFVIFLISYEFFMYHRCDILVLRWNWSIYMWIFFKKKKQKKMVFEFFLKFRYVNVNGIWSWIRRHKNWSFKWKTLIVCGLQCILVNSVQFGTIRYSVRLRVFSSDSFFIPFSSQFSIVGLVRSFALLFDLLRVVYQIC